MAVRNSEQGEAVVTKSLQAKRDRAGSIRDQQLEQFNARAGAELAKLLPEIDAVRADKDDMARAACGHVGIIFYPFFPRISQHRPHPTHTPRAMLLSVPMRIGC